MLEELLASSVDHTLTPQDAHAQGYQWVIDVLRSEKAAGGIEGLTYIQQKITIEGYKLGQSWANDIHIAPYGLYRPLAQSAQPPKKG